MRDLAQFAAKAQLIRFTGGEPTVNGYLRKFLQYLKEYTKEYIFNRSTHEVLYKALQDEIQGKKNGIWKLYFFVLGNYCTY